MDTPGVTVRPLNDQLRAHNGVPDDVNGLMVVDVESRSQAAREGLVRKDAVVAVNDLRADAGPRSQRCALRRRHHCRNPTWPWTTSALGRT